MGMGLWFQTLVKARSVDILCDAFVQGDAGSDPDVFGLSIDCIAIVDMIEEIKVRR